MSNQLPEFALRITIDTRQDPSAEDVTRLVSEMIGRIRCMPEIDEDNYIVIDHVGRGSTVIQFLLQNLDTGITVASIAVGLAALLKSRPSQAPVLQQIVNNYGAETVVISASGLDNPLVFRKKPASIDGEPPVPPAKARSSIEQDWGGPVTISLPGKYIDWNRTFETIDGTLYWVENGSPQKLGDPLTIEAYLANRRSRTGLPVIIAVTTRPRL